MRGSGAVFRKKKRSRRVPGGQHAAGRGAAVAGPPARAVAGYLALPGDTPATWELYRPDLDLDGLRLLDRAWLEIPV